MKKVFLLLLAIFSLNVCSAQKFESNWASLNKRKMPEWFHQDKFGIFIHWGLYSVPAYAPVIENSGLSYAEWYWNRIEPKQPNEFTAFHNKNYGADFLYPQFEPMFRAELFDPQQWAQVLRNSGARYVVLTSKHHEGYCLWNSPEADRDWGRPWNAVSGTPKRDLLGDLTNAVRMQGLKMGYYYSLYEWYNPLWLKDKNRFVTEHMIPQFKDLVTKYKPSIIFADGEWDLPDTAWHSPELLAWLFNDSPVAKEVVVDDRWGGNTREKNTGATYTTSEYGGGKDANIIWEESQGIGHSYGYNRNEKLEDYKTSHDLILMLVDIVSRGGNLLLDIGPTADGRIPVIMQQRLADIGSWLKVNGDAIYETEAYKQSYQWSGGIKRQKSGKNYMAGYSVSQMIKPQTDTAYVEAFFTRKGNDLFCILPAYTPKFKLRDMHLKTNVTATVLGSSKTLKWVKQKNDDIIDLSALKPSDASSELLVIKLKNAL
ncbi:alpha-L-fucosidase [Mucilaginibacter aquaedulcis]|uniref:alpha-L-fucosidase n=1 Tax=Mucilaginibacter aquaedulcis TaxID=1187081 RepID=UPI0025B37313|nr:alpha-L-fucosidase [Mucilaginibacter aquaedulcis]MDN3548365.1 alpha-L-fucosidase [Mucilaginibacter aquaedulcis]